MKRFRRIAKWAAVTIAAVAGVVTVSQPWDPCASLVFAARRGAPGCNMAPPGELDLTTPWTVRTMVAGGGGDKTGADGMHGMDVNGDGRLDWVSGFEQGSSIFIAFHPGYSNLGSEWPHVKVGTNPSVEDAKFGDVDGDGWTDVISGGEGERLVVHFSPTNLTDQLDASKWSQISISEAFGDYDYFQIAFGDMDGDSEKDIVTLGRDTSPLDAKLGWWTAPANPRDASGWTFHEIADVEWGMTLLVLNPDGDGDQDVLISDRTGANAGARWFQNDGTGLGWTNKPISTPSPGTTRMIGVGDVDGDGDQDVATGSSGTAGQSNNGNDVSYGDATWSSWSTVTLTDPGSVGDYQAAAVCDLDGDLKADLVYSYSDADLPGEGGVVWMRQDPIGTFTVGTISGAVGEKYDNVVCSDVDNDGDLDIVTSEQNVGLGMIWFENQLDL